MKRKPIEVSWDTEAIVITRHGYSGYAVHLDKTEGRTWGYEASNGRLYLGWQFDYDKDRIILRALSQDEIKSLESQL